MDRPTGYLYRVAMNLFRARWRRMKIEVRPRPSRHAEADAFAQIADQDQAARVLARLPRRQRAALVLTEMLEFDSAEAGELLKIKPTTVRVLAHQARERLRREIGAEDA
jgi:DNA-directed RNA polymerase specialized sigma24 family protein